MSEFEKLYESTIIEELFIGQLVKGQVVNVGKGEVFVDIGYKAEGIIPLGELAYPVPERAGGIVEAGQLLKLVVVALNDNEGNVTFSKIKADRMIAWQELTAAVQAEQAVTGKVTEVVKGGVVAAVSGLRGFIPASQLELKYTEDLEKYVGQTIELLPIEVEEQIQKLVLSRKKLLQLKKERDEQRLFPLLVLGRC